ncbi:response regulator [Bacteriovorax stolpii]|uniref:response regulator n=1 Tax=Bacteriovorax stolpii TaxID=960 RepID=UPI00115BCFF4|nr:response regulator [Bacteriovorax stolpii]QDK42729.1 response regulator [Bacteriovorax stolpii]
MTALVVDDCEDLRTCLSLLLITEGYSVKNASNGLIALQLLKERKIPLKLLITDYDMPEMNGGKLVEELISQNIEVKKIIILSGMNQNEAKIEHLLKKHPNIKFINKLITTQELLKHINN